VTPWLQPGGTIEATSFYDTKDLKRTLERLVDFDRLNAGAPRFSVGAVNVRTGNFVYFDNTTHTIHVMASGALPPGFPAIEIEGEHYWDGGLVSNTPLQWVVEGEPRRDTLAFQVDLWNARGEFPRNMLEVVTREKEIRYSSRTRAGTDQLKHVQKMRRAMAGLLEQLPEELKDSPEAELQRDIARSITSKRRRRWLHRLRAECPGGVPLWAAHFGYGELPCILPVTDFLVLGACQ
jgi:NTE family protein